MSPNRQTASASETVVEWDAVRRAMYGHLARRLGAGDRANLEDLVQEACVRLLRALRREGARNLEALQTTIAQRTWIDHVRRRERWRRVIRPEVEPETANPGGAMEEELPWGDVEERLRFVVFGIFEREGASGCRELAAAYFEETDWRTVGERLRLAHTVVRKRWSRCLERVRRTLVADAEWSRLLGRDVPG